MRERIFSAAAARLLRIYLAALALALSSASKAAEKLPPTPPRYFNDFAGLVSPATATELDRKLEQFERDTSNQVLVAIYPKMESDSSVEDFTQRTAESWKVGQKKIDNGVVLFVFLEPRKIRLEVGYGLEGVIPDATAKRITEDIIKPAFQQRRFDDGLRAGVDAILQAARGEFKGTGRTVADRRGRDGSGAAGLLCPIVGFLLLFMIMRRFAGGGSVYDRRGRRRYVGGGPWFFPMGGGGWGGGGGGGWGGGGGGGFSGGGGGFGGGGAGSDW